MSAPTAAAPTTAPLAMAPVASSPKEVSQPPLAAKVAPGEANHETRITSENWELLRSEPAQISSTSYSPRPLIDSQEDKTAWQKVPPRLQRSSDVYDQKSGNGPSAVMEFEVTKSGYLILACHFGTQGNGGGDWQQTRLKREDFESRGWQAIDDATLGGSVVARNRQQVVFAKWVVKGEKYSLRCNKYDPPFAILFK